MSETVSYAKATIYAYQIIDNMVLVIIDPPYPPITMTLGEWEANGYTTGSTLPNKFVKVDEVNKALGLDNLPSIQTNVE